MKEKNKKGLFSLFQKRTRSEEALEETVNPLSSEASENEAVEDLTAEPEIQAVPETADITPDVTPETEDTIPLPPPIWEPSDDPLVVKVNEDILNIECAQFVSRMESESDVPEQTDSSSEEQEPQPRAAEPHLYLSNDRMAAWVYVTHPLNGGQDISEKDLKTLLTKEHVTAGILEDALKSITEDHIYDQAVLIAKGTLARDGVDGSIKELFKRELHLEFEEDEKGSVDYKNLNNIQSVKEGQVICEITLAIPGENGMTVTGQPYPYTVKGTDVSVPYGRNTTLNEDRTLLISQKTGHVTFVNGKFQVDPILRIDGGIDNNTGNLDYDGDIFIKGDVRNGFTVKATGSVEIRGSVEGAHIIAQGPITISSGVSGNGKGVLTSESYIKCRYLEHCTVSAGGNVYAESIINSKVESGQDIVVTSGSGVIIGGSLLATNNINARVIGSKLHRLITELTIAGVPKYVDEASRLTREMEQLQHNKSEMRKNIIYLETSQRQDKQQLLEKFNQATDYLNTREQEITDRLNEITKNDSEQNGLIKCRQILPVVRIRIGSANLLIQEEYSSCIIYKNSEGEITIGSN
ncbi:FapA family protein [Lachnospiraceae bacterium 54-53]